MAPATKSFVRRSAADWMQQRPGVSRSRRPRVRYVRGRRFLLRCRGGPTPVATMYPMVRGKSAPADVTGRRSAAIPLKPAFESSCPKTWSEALVDIIYRYDPFQIAHAVATRQLGIGAGEHPA